MLRFELHGPARVHPGQAVRYELERIGDDPVDTLDLTARASRGCTLETGRTFLGEIARVYAGDARRVPIDVVIPPFPSHAMSVAWSGVWIDVRAARGKKVIEHRFPLHVCEPLVERSSEPAVARTQQFVELALGLGATRVTGGTTLVGQCSIAGLTSDTRIALEVVCVVRAASGYVRKFPICSAKLHVPRHAAAAGVPFTVPLPDYLAPTLAIDTHQIQYALEARHKQWRGTTTVSLPLHVVDAFPAPARIRPPDLGERQVERVFEQVAERAGWRIGPLVDADSELGTIVSWLFAAQGGVVMRLGYAFHADGSTYLVSRIRYRPLELGFRVVRSRHGGTLRSGDADWDDEHVATARDVARATEILTTVVPTLGPLGTLVRWDDDWLICERAVEGVELALVDEVATALRSVARHLAQAIRSDELPVGPYR